MHGLEGSFRKTPSPLPLAPPPLRSSAPATRHQIHARFPPKSEPAPIIPWPLRRHQNPLVSIFTRHLNRLAFLRLPPKRLATTPPNTHFCHTHPTSPSPPRLTAPPSLRFTPPSTAFSGFGSDLTGR